MKDLLNTRETRRVQIDTELREVGTDSLTFEGYASLFDSPYDVYGGPSAGGWIETVDSRAFNRTLKAAPDVVFLVNHEGLPLARTSSGTMDLATDQRGLHVRASFDPANPRVSELASGMRRGDVSQMSFAFRTKNDSWNPAETERRLLEVSLDRGDVSAVTNGANPATSSSLRSFLDSISDEVLVAELRSADLGSVRAAYDFLAGLLRERTPVGMSLAQAERILLLDA